MKRKHNSVVKSVVKSVMQNKKKIKIVNCCTEHTLRVVTLRKIFVLFYQQEMTLKQSI